MDGRTRRIGFNRVLVLDVVRLARKVPAFPVEKGFQLAEVAHARQRCQQRISWVALFAKAYALAAQEHPQLRQSFINWPWPRVFQSPYSIISVAVNRMLENGEERLFFGRLRFPDCKPLTEVQSELDAYVNSDVHDVFKEQCKGAYIPGILRRLGWWWRMEVAVAKRARRLGTGSMSVLAGYGVLNRQHPCMLTSSLSYGPIDSNGEMWVTLQCDHRVLDGAAAARSLNSIATHLQTSILQELETLAEVKSTAA